MQFFSYKCWFLRLCLVSATGETWMFVATPCDTQLPSLSWKTFLCPFSSGWWFVGRFLQRCCAGQVVLFSSMLLDHNWQDLKNFYCNVISAFQNYWSWAQTSEGLSQFGHIPPRLDGHEQPPRQQTGSQTQPEETSVFGRFQVYGKVSLLSRGLWFDPEITLPRN